jgi:hypothetical protein
MKYTLLAEPKYPSGRKFDVKFDSFVEAINAAKNIFAGKDFTSVRLRVGESTIHADVIQDIFQAIDRGEPANVPRLSTNLPKIADLLYMPGAGDIELDIPPRVIEPPRLIDFDLD